jgi:DNA-binding PadR family transcriptional regulator
MLSMRPMRRWHQYAKEVLAFLGTGSRTGREIRQHLNAGRPWWRCWGGIALYQLLSEMEDAGLLERAIEIHVICDMSVPLDMFRRRED